MQLRSSSYIVSGNDAVQYQDKNQHVQLLGSRGWSLGNPALMSLSSCFCRAWYFIVHNFRKKGALLVTVPSLQEALSSHQVSTENACKNCLFSTL